MIDILWSVLILVLIFTVIWWGLTQIALPDPFGKIVRVVVIVLFCLMLIGLLAGLGHGLPHFRLYD